MNRCSIALVTAWLARLLEACPRTEREAGLEKIGAGIKAALSKVATN